MTAINIGELTKHLNMLDVYETVTKDFPEMRLQIEKILE